MLPTPSTSHVPYTRVYEPAEDSFLLLDTLSSSSETAFLKIRFSSAVSKPTPLVVELGSGSGVVIAFLAANAQAIFGRDVLVSAVDINIEACKATAETVRKAVSETRSLEAGGDGDNPQHGTRRAARRANEGTFLGPLNANLISPLRPSQVDVFVFNPPYVPTSTLPSQGPPSPSLSSFDQDSHLLELSYAGGKDGMETTERVLDELKSGEVLSERGVAYVLLCKGNKPEEVCERIRGWDGGWSCEIVGTSGKTAGWEKLVVVRIWKAGD